MKSYVIKHVKTDLSSKMIARRNSFKILNRKEGNDQESIQLPNTFRSKTPKGKKDALKATAPQSKHYKQKAKRAVSFQNIGQTAPTKPCFQYIF